MSASPEPADAAEPAEAADDAPENAEAEEQPPLNRRERRAAGKKAQSVPKTPIRGKFAAAPQRRDYAARRRG